MNNTKQTTSVHSKNNNPIIMGLFKKNALLVSGMVVAPAVAFANTLYNALTLALVFSTITFFTIIISSFIPQKMVYTIRIILYTLIASIVYIPLIAVIGSIFPNLISQMGIFVPLMITNSFIISKSEVTFFRENKVSMVKDVLYYILGYDIIVILYGALRELISVGQIGGRTLGMTVVLSAGATTFGGFIILGLCAGIFRFILLIIRSVE